MIATAAAATIHLNRGPGASSWLGFDTTVGATTQTSGVRGRGGDVNGDGFADLVVASSSSRLYLNKKNDGTTADFVGLDAATPGRR